jgi:hypothetical protein
MPHIEHRGYAPPFSLSLSLSLCAYMRRAHALSVHAQSTCSLCACTEYMLCVCMHRAHAQSTSVHLREDTPCAPLCAPRGAATCLTQEPRKSSHRGHASPLYSLSLVCSAAYPLYPSLRARRRGHLLSGRISMEIEMLESKSAPVHLREDTPCAPACAPPLLCAATCWTQEPRKRRRAMRRCGSRRSITGSA